MLRKLPNRVSIYEVSLRDGLQNEPAPIETSAKLRLLEALINAGLERIELTSFVSPRWVPQLADAEELCQRAEAPPGVSLSALCPNAKGFERARASKLKEIAVFLSASETHNRKNTNKSVAQFSGCLRRSITTRSIRSDAGSSLRFYRVGLPL